MLPEFRRRGLIGELTFLQRAVRAWGSKASVEGWMGPARADQDFLFPDGWHEIKTLSSGSNRVTISSLQQLDAPLPGDLTVYCLDKTNELDDKGFSLHDLVENVRNAVSEDLDAAAIYASKLADYGYMDLPEYARDRYRLGGTQRYEVRADFPRLVRHDVPEAVAEVRYDLDLQELGEWSVE